MVWSRLKTALDYFTILYKNRIRNEGILKNNTQSADPTPLPLKSLNNKFIDMEQRTVGNKINNQSKSLSTIDTKQQ